MRESTPSMSVNTKAKQHEDTERDMLALVQALLERQLVSVDA